MICACWSCACPINEGHCFRLGERLYCEAVCALRCRDDWCECDDCAGRLENPPPGLEPATARK